MRSGLVLSCRRTDTSFSFSPSKRYVALRRASRCMLGRGCSHMKRSPTRVSDLTASDVQSGILSWKWTSRASWNKGDRRTASATRLLVARAIAASSSSKDWLSMLLRMPERDLGVMSAVITETFYILRLIWRVSLKV